MSKSRGRSVGTFPPRTSDGRALATGSTGGGGGAPTTATFITQIPDAGLSAEQALSLLATGLMKSTTATGVVSTIVPGAGIETWLGAPSSANLLAALTTKTGTGLAVFDTTPTFTTNITAPLIIGGTGAASTLTLRSSSNGAAGAGADVIVQVGLNGSIEGARWLNSGFFGLGTATPKTILDVSQNTAWGTFTPAYTGAAALAAVGLVRQVVTTRPPGVLVSQAILGYSEFTQTGSPTLYFMFGLNALSLITDSDNATYAANSVQAAGSYLTRYNGTGTIPNVYGISVTAVRGNAGNITGAMVGVDVSLQNDLSGTSGTITVTAGLRINRPVGKALMTWTDIRGVDIGDMSPLLGTQTNVSRALRIQAQSNVTGEPYALEQLGANNLIFWAGKFTTYANRTTAGWGVPGLYASYSTTGNTAAVTNAINYAPPATAGRYRISGVVNMTAWTTPSVGITVVVTYKDDSGTARTETLGVVRGSTGAAVAAVTAIDRWYFELPLLAIDNSATAITVSTAGTFTGSPVYNLSAVLEQAA